jgi:4-aminobutyrate aminotransferase-like enzyme
MALAQIAEIKRLKLVQRSARLGRILLRELSACVRTDIRVQPGSIRGLGLMAGLELRRPDGSPASVESIDLIKRMLQRGFLLLPEGEHGNVISFTPPLTITEPQIRRVIRILGRELAADTLRSI